MKTNELDRLHKDSMFRGLFKIYANFIQLLKMCRNNSDLDITEDDIKAFDLGTEYTNRQRRNDVSFITKDNRLIILVEHQSTFSPNWALKLFLYYIELLQLWIKLNNIDIHGKKEVPLFPMPELYVIYRGKTKLKEKTSVFSLDYSDIKINVKVQIIDIGFDSLESKETNSPIAGYSFFYSCFDKYSKTMNLESAFEKARQECIKKGYLKGFIEKEDFIIMYKDFLDYDAQVFSNGRDEGRDEGKGEKALETAYEMLKDGFSIEKIAHYVKMPVDWLEENLLAEVAHEK